MSLQSMTKSPRKKPISPLTGRSRDFLELVLPSAAGGHLAAVKYYLSQEPRFLDAIGPHGRTMIWEAANKGRLETVEYLADAGADIEARGCHFRDTMVELSPWCIAHYRKKVTVAALLLDRGAKYGIESACYLGDRERVETLLRGKGRPADRVVHKTSESGDRPIEYAVAGGHLSIVELLIQKGADVATGGERLVSWAFEHGPRIVKTLLHHGARPRPEDANEACLEPEWAEILGEYGYALDINAPDRLGFPPLVEACRGNHNAKEDVREISDLLDRGARVDVRDHKQKTALHRAAQAGFGQIVTQLLKAGADLEAADGKGETPIFDAVRAGRPDTVAQLLSAGANLGHRNDLDQDLVTIAARIRKPGGDAVRALLAGS